MASDVVPERVDNVESLPRTSVGADESAVIESATKSRAIPDGLKHVMKELAMSLKKTDKLYIIFSSAPGSILDWYAAKYNYPVEELRHRLKEMLEKERVDEEKEQSPCAAMSKGPKSTSEIKEKEGRTTPVHERKPGVRLRFQRVSPAQKRKGVKILTPTAPAKKKRSERMKEPKAIHLGMGEEGAEDVGESDEEKVDQERVEDEPVRDNGIPGNSVDGGLEESDEEAADDDGLITPGSEGRQDKCDFIFRTGVPCGFIGTKKMSIAFHRHRAHPVIHSCTKCDFSSTRRERVKFHQLTHGDAKPFKCSSCEKSFKRKQHLMRHNETEHNNPGKKYICTLCKREFSWEVTLEEHTRSKHGGIKYSCPHCEFQTVYKRALKKHITRRHKEESIKDNRVLEPEESSEEAADDDGLSDNRTAPGSKEKKSKLLECSICEKSFTRNSSFWKHKKTAHANLGKKYPCTICKKEFRIYGLKDHMKAVHSSKSYHCPQCDYVAPWAARLKTHVQSVHEGIKYPCSHCDYQATKDSNLRKHIRSVHDGVRNFPCSQCDYKAKATNDLKKHIARRH